jgi:hypothetical protein
MAIETLDDIVGDLADKLGIYGGCPNPGHEGCGKCTCRQGWEADMKARIREAVEVDRRMGLQFTGECLGTFYLDRETGRLIKVQDNEPLAGREDSERLAEGVVVPIPRCHIKFKPVGGCESVKVPIPTAVQIRDILSRHNEPLAGPTAKGGSAEGVVGILSLAEKWESEAQGMTHIYRNEQDYSTYHTLKACASELRSLANEPMAGREDSERSVRRVVDSTSCPACGGSTHHEVRCGVNMLKCDMHDCRCEIPLDNVTPQQTRRARPRALRGMLEAFVRSSPFS